MCLGCFKKVAAYIYIYLNAIRRLDITATVRHI